MLIFAVFQPTADHRRGFMEALMYIKFNISVYFEQTVRVSLMNQFRVHTKPSYKLSVDKSLALNNIILDGWKKLNEILFVS